MSSTTGRVLIESAIALTILVAATSWGAWYWNQSLAMGRHPFFYQLYYEPAVMVACGKGFVVAQPQVPAMTRFLQEQTTEFDCRDIPPGTKLGSDGLYQGSSRYLMTAVGWSWRFTGVSWRRLGPVTGVLFGVTIAAAYAIFRLGMGRVLAAALAVVLSLSPLHLLNLPHVRDYSKAPFVLLLVSLLGLLVKVQPSWKRVIAIGAAYGVVMGIGYGFRTDLVINFPPFLLAALFFVDAPWRRRFAFGAGAAVACIAAFLVSAAPVLSAITDTSRCEWHVAALGLGDDATHDLGLARAPYDWMDGFTDEFAYATVTSYTARLHPGTKHIDYCTGAYDDATRAFIFDVIRHTPADFVVRAYASSLQMVQLPLRWRRPPMPHLAVDYYRFRRVIAEHVQDAGLLLVVATTFLVTAASVRLGLFLIVFLLYFGSYPAVQFANRHFFHLEFIALWAFGFLLQQVVTRVIALVRNRRMEMPSPRDFARSAGVLMMCFVVLFSGLWLARWYQASAVEEVLQPYLKAQVDQLTTEQSAGHVLRVASRGFAKSDPETSDLLEVDLNESRCQADSRLTFVYDASHLGFARDVPIVRGTSRIATRIFVPVYAGFQGVSIGDAPARCLEGVYRVEHADQFALMPKVVMRPGWADRPLHQSLIGWGIEPPADE